MTWHDDYDGNFSIIKIRTGFNLLLTDSYLARERKNQTSKNWSTSNVQTLQAAVLMFELCVQTCIRNPFHLKVSIWTGKEIWSTCILLVTYAIFYVRNMGNQIQNFHNIFSFCFTNCQVKKKQWIQKGDWWRQIESAQSGAEIVVWSQEKVLLLSVSSLFVCHSRSIRTWPHLKAVNGLTKILAN